VNIKEADRQTFVFREDIPYVISFPSLPSSSLNLQRKGVKPMTSSLERKEQKMKLIAL
jgi:hypothetical protein